MLFYASLLMTSLLMTVVILALYKLVVMLLKQFLRSSGRAEPASHPGGTKYGQKVNGTAKSFGQPGIRAQPSGLYRTHPAKPGGPIPWGWPGNHHEHHDSHAAKVSQAVPLKAYLRRANALGKKQTVDDWKHNVGRPVRDDRPALAGTAYKPSIANFPDFDNNDR